MKRWLTKLSENPFWATNMRRQRRHSIFRRYGVDALAQFGLLGALLGLTVLEPKSGVAVPLICLHLLYLACASTAATATSVVSERAKGSLLTLALTKVNSAEYADGVAMSAAHGLLRNQILAWPLLVAALLYSNTGLMAGLLYPLISASVTIFGAYYGVKISATSKDARQASQRALLWPLLSLLGTPLLIPFGGFILFPFWLAHPFFALSLDILGYTLPYSDSSDSISHLIFWKGWVLLFPVIYYVFIRNTRRSGILALERIPLQ